MAQLTENRGGRGWVGVKEALNLPGLICKGVLFRKKYIKFTTTIT